MIKKLFSTGCALIMILSVLLIFTPSLASDSEPTTRSSRSTSTIEVSDPIRLTSDSYYERGQSITKGGGYYWLFWGRSTDETGNYDTGDPDGATYDTYFMKATTLAGLESGSPTAVTGADNIYQGQTSCVYYGGKVWVFAADENDGHGIKAWHSTNGLSWSEHDTGIDACGAPHLWATVYDGKIFLVYNAVGNKLEVRTYAGVSWSSADDASSNEGMPRFYEDSGGDLHMIWCSWGMPAYYIHTYNNGWSTTPDHSITGTENDDCDPTLFQIGGSGDYCLMYAPWDGTQQYIAAWTAATLSGLEYADSCKVTAGSYGGSPWVDMWPIAFNDGGNDYLFYTSERKDDGTCGTGNIWYMPVDWDTYNNHYTYIQNAIDNADPGDTVIVHDGTYNEQLIIDKSLTLQSGSKPKLVAPDTRSTYTFQESGYSWDPLIFAYGGSLSGSHVSGTGTISVTVDCFEIDC
ncbi:MAG: hypothetical protein JSV49_02880 [Thermoplasmata archaeon]|nr:MAG: hypothetical protein JSV49_02880 [Thermoplasmata archaeon]